MYPEILQQWPYIYPVGLTFKQMTTEISVSYPFNPCSINYFLLKIIKPTIVISPFKSKFSKPKI